MVRKKKVQDPEVAVEAVAEAMVEEEPMEVESAKSAPKRRGRERPLPVVDFEAVARRGAEAAEDKKATRVVVMHLGDTSPVSDYFVLVSGKTRIQTRAIANGIDEALKDTQVPRTRQGYQAGNWILLDYGGVVFHIFLEREREYYNLEGLYAKAPIIYTSEGEHP